MTQNSVKRTKKLKVASDAMLEFTVDERSISGRGHYCIPSHLSLATRGLQV
jgi:hypothetical protein